ncbi:MFS transporter [Lactococcus formosensis]|uniref:MFS transporter n=1 Tax=Lactococcus formosensis TaxID=1281486 RepID=UPI00030F9741|nr:MFS transporter [Lactococcus formosensis]MCH1723482.1 MFS transporter [Lactococcus formosensis]MDG6113399.1 MFS transporter [Lactococcus formosensis]MDG6116488.1 MFS transporter [Lactococcus formosensis]MDG6121634.1 MFS transporter [Lactococcus formosensis]MDG6123195.1 MFS transporter [Lactococcus formosensis]
MKKEKFGAILPITLLSYFLILMDNSIVFTSSVQIGNSLGLTPAALSWVSSAYTLTFGGLLLLSGRLSDLIGRKRIFLIGLLIFGVSSLVIGISNSAEIVITMRAIQGIGSSIIAPTTLALIMDAYQNDMRQRAISYYGATAGIGSSIGLLVGGGLTSLISWRAGFLINVPFTILLFILTLKYVKHSEIKKESIDYLGSFLSIIGLVGVIYGLTEGELNLVFIGMLFLVVFIFWEKKTLSPLLPLVLFKNKIRSGAYITRLLFMMTMLPFWFFLPQMMQNQYGFSALESGFAFLPLTIVNFIIALQLPKLTMKFGNNMVLLFGEMILGIGLILLALSNYENGYWQTIFIPMIILGLGQGLILAPVTSAGVHEAPDNLAGIASGVTNTMHQIGGPIGLSLIISTTTDFQNKIWVMVAFTIISILVVCTILQKRDTNV